MVIIVIQLSSQTMFCYLIHISIQVYLYGCLHTPFLHLGEGGGESDCCCLPHAGTGLESTSSVFRSIASHPVGTGCWPAKRNLAPSLGTGDMCAVQPRTGRISWTLSLTHVIWSTLYSLQSRIYTLYNSPHSGLHPTVFIL